MSTPQRATLEIPLPPDTTIDWDCPAPRAGWRGLLDKTAGPGATAGEVRLAALACVVAVAALLAAVQTGALGVSWSLVQVLTACFLALNVGFLAIIGSGASKRWYHRGAGVSGKALALVLADGLFQLGLANVVFAWGDWRFVAYLGVYFVLGGLTIVRVPLHRRRSAALLLCFTGIVAARYFVPGIAGLEWFPIVFFLKYFIAHIPREEPYRPK